MREWLHEYERVARRQKEYLQRIKDLRRSLENREEQFMMVAIERLRRIQKGRFRDPKYPQIGHLSRKNCPGGPEAFPRRSCVLNDSHGRFYMAPNVLPRKLAPLFKNKRRLALLPAYGPVDRLKTDYEPIESIAKRNNIDLHHYICHSKMDKHGRHVRQALSVATVTVKDNNDDDDSVEDLTLEYITDVSSKKTLLNFKK